MIDGERHNVVVFNGEIYNYAELRARPRAARRSVSLERRHRGPAARLRPHGADIVQRLRGMFAFAVFDPTRRSVLLARDRLGIKPLYYCELRRPAGPVLLFASELRALLASGLCRAAPRPARPQHLPLERLRGRARARMIRGDQAARAGRAHARVDSTSRKPRPERYWSLAASRKLPADEAVAGARRRASTAARQHLVSDVPLGVFLSGGVDSSAVAALARPRRQPPREDVSHRLRRGGVRRVAYARRVARLARHRARRAAR